MTGTERQKSDSTGNKEAWRGGAAVALALLPLLSLPAPSQEPKAPPSFPTQAAAITVDVVVLDGSGQPVRGLTRDDFTVLEDGKAQPIVGFDAREVSSIADDHASSLAPERVATNADVATRPERVFALLIDDLGIAPQVAQQLKPALARWLRERAHPRDEVTLVTTSGDVWWSDVVGAGREDLIAALERVEGKQSSLLGRNDPMTEWEAYWISLQEPSESPGGAGELPADQRQGDAEAGGTSRGVVERVVARWVLARVCLQDPMESPPYASCRRRVRMRASEIHAASTRRARAVLDGIERLSRALKGTPGRKSILLVSETLLQDTLTGNRLQQAIDASQQANTAVYFVGAQGLAGRSFLDVQQSGPVRGGDLGSMGAEQMALTAGGQHLAEATGGAAVTTSNDLAEGLERMATDSSAYYLLGYQPEDVPDGRWHKLDVKVSRKDLRVRARRTYLAARQPASPVPIADASSGRKGSKEHDKSKRALAPALLAGTSRGEIPLRLASYVRGPEPGDVTRVLVTLEIDSRRVQMTKAMAGAEASLDLTILGMSLGRPIPAAMIDQRLDLTLESGGPESWWTVNRDIFLAPGVAQVRALVRDRTTGATGIVTQRLVVPSPSEPYLSTPILTDRTLPGASPGDPPRLVPTARRRFRPAGVLFCQYEVFAFAGQGLPGVPRVNGSHALQTSEGRSITLAPATPIASNDGRMVRRIAVPLDALEPGPYELILTVEDQLTQRTLVTREAFAVERDES